MKTTHPTLECFVFIPQKIILKMKFLHVTKSKFEFKHDLKFMAVSKKSFVPKKEKNQSMSVVQEEQNINLIFMEIGQGRGFSMSIFFMSHRPGFHGRPETNHQDPKKSNSSPFLSRSFHPLVKCYWRHTQD